MIITYSELGYHGRLGNQMFQYAALVGIANKLGCSYGINYKNSESTKICGYNNEKLELLEGFDLSAKDISNQAIPQRLYQEKSFHFEEGVFEISSDTEIVGTFQSEKYFRHCRDLVRSEFEFKPHIKTEAEKKINNIKDERQLVSIHIRRGDYKKLQSKHPICSMAYYKKAMTFFPNSKFVVFSDDIDWCEKHLVGDNFVYVSGNNQFVDMCMMSLCNHHIIANSSFSWWGAWLNPNLNKKVIAPIKWFGLDFIVDTKDLYCEDWTITGSSLDYLECKLFYLASKPYFSNLINFLAKTIPYFYQHPERLIPDLKNKFGN